MTWAVHNFDSIKILNAITSLHTRRNRSRRVGPLSVYQTYTLPMMSSVSLVEFPYGYGYHIMDSSINYYKQMRVRKKKKTTLPQISITISAHGGMKEGKMSGNIIFLINSTIGNSK